jgi:2-polyprenyl-3-methyl-5-hydroxy-6-metoxy-1,4-benzoquinol methylase
MTQYQQIEWTDEKVTDFWNFESQFPNRYFTYTHGAGMLKHLSKYFVDSMSILDYGCGAGLFLALLAERGHQVTGADTSEQSLKVTHERLQEYENFLGAFTPNRLLAEGKQFDTIFAVELVEHLYDDHLNDLLRMLHRLVTPEGRIIVTTPNQEKLEDSFLMCPCCKSVFHRWQHVRFWSKASLTDYVERRGFQVLDAFTTDFSTVETEQERWEKLSRWKRFKRTLKGKAPKEEPSLGEKPCLVVVFRAAR